MADGITPMGDAFLAASQLREAFEDLSPAQINALDMSSYAAIRRRAGLPEADPFSEVYESNSAPPGRLQRPAQTAPPAAEHLDFSQLSISEYTAVRGQYIRPASGTGRGLFD